MGSTLDSIERHLTRLGTSRYLHPRFLKYACASCGLLCGLFFFAAFVAAGFIPPARPWWTAERTSEHYIHHRVGIHTGCVLMVISGMFFLPYLVIVSDQIRRIPNVPWILPALQLASGAGSVFTFIVPGMVLAVGAYRKDRDPALVELMNDMFWLFAIMPFQTFWPMSWSLSYAILIDNREKPLFPKVMAVANFFGPLLFAASFGVHVAKTGPFAWNGGFGFWVPAVAFGLQFCGDTYFLCRAIYREYVENDDVSLGQISIIKEGKVEDSLK